MPANSRHAEIYEYTMIMLRACRSKESPEHCDLQKMTRIKYLKLHLTRVFYLDTTG